ESEPGPGRSEGIALARGGLDRRRPGGAGLVSPEPAAVDPLVVTGARVLRRSVRADGSADAGDRARIRWFGERGAPAAGARSSGAPRRHPDPGCPGLGVKPAVPDLPLDRSAQCVGATRLPGSAGDSAHSGRTGLAES